MGLTQERFAVLGGVLKRAQLNYEKGERQPDSEYLSSIAAAGADVLYILTGTRAPVQTALNALRSATEIAQKLGGSPEEQAKAQEVLFEQLRQLQSGQPSKPIEPGQAANDYVYVPRYDVQASAGNGAVVHDESVVDHLAFRRDWVTRTLGLDAQHLALIDVSGDSMAPTIGDGDLILIDTRPRPVKSEGVYVINLHSALLVKRLRLRISGEMDVVSDNPLYGTETVNGDQLGQLQIVGRVVWQGRRL